MPYVTVIMNGYNCEEYVEQAIKSVYSQTYMDWEIVFWDNASTDRTSDIACKFDERLRYFRGVENVPLGMARNYAIMEARGELIAFLDTDDYWLEYKLEKQVYQFKADLEIVLAYSNFYQKKQGNSKLDIGFRKIQPIGDVFGSFLRYFPLNLQTVVVRRSKLVQLGEIFDKRLNLAEDYDLFMRVVYRGKVAYSAEPLAVYRLHSNMNSIKFATKYPDELEYCVNKLKTIYPESCINYSNCYTYLDEKIKYWHAKSLMIQGRKIEARKLLSRSKNGIFFILYISTFLPAKLWLKLQELRYILR